MAIEPGVGVGVGVVEDEVVVVVVMVVVGGAALLVVVLVPVPVLGLRASSIIVVAMVERASGGWPVRYKRKRFKRFKFLAPNGVCPPAVGVARAEPEGRERGKRNVKVARNPPIVAGAYQPLRIRGNLIISSSLGCVNHRRTSLRRRASGEPDTDRKIKEAVILSISKPRARPPTLLMWWMANGILHELALGRARACVRAPTKPHDAKMRWAGWPIRGPLIIAGTDSAPRWKSWKATWGISKGSL